MTNEQKVLSVLFTGKKITIRQAQNDLLMNGGTFTKVISNLRKNGFDIKTEMRKRKNRSGVTKHYKVYWLAM